VKYSYMWNQCIHINIHILIKRIMHAYIDVRGITEDLSLSLSLSVCLSLSLSLSLLDLYYLISLD
jgi:hypothetical protein